MYHLSDLGVDKRKTLLKALTPTRLFMMRERIQRSIGQAKSKLLIFPKIAAAILLIYNGEDCADWSMRFNVMISLNVSISFRGATLPLLWLQEEQSPNSCPPVGLPNSLPMGMGTERIEES